MYGLRGAKNSRIIGAYPGHIPTFLIIVCCVQSGEVSRRREGFAWKRVVGQESRCWGKEDLLKYLVWIYRKVW